MILVEEQRPEREVQLRPPPPPLHSSCVDERTFPTSAETHYWTEAGCLGAESEGGGAAQIRWSRDLSCNFKGLVDGS
jgi:hypothetical protein